VMELRAHGLPQRGYVFPRLDGLDGPNTPARVSRLCGQYLHGLGIPEPLHSLRHYFGSSLYAASQDLRLTGEVMGHQSPATTAGYVSYSHAAAVEAVERGRRRPRRPRYPPLRSRFVRWPTSRARGDTSLVLDGAQATG